MAREETRGNRGDPTGGGSRGNRGDRQTRRLGGQEMTIIVPFHTYSIKVELGEEIMSPIYLSPRKKWRHAHRKKRLGIDYPEPKTRSDWLRDWLEVTRRGHCRRLDSGMTLTLLPAEGIGNDRQA